MQGKEFAVKRRGGTDAGTMETHSMDQFDFVGVGHTCQCREKGGSNVDSHGIRIFCCKECAWVLRICVLSFWWNFSKSFGNVTHGRWWCFVGADDLHMIIGVWSCWGWGCGVVGAVFGHWSHQGSWHCECAETMKDKVLDFLVVVCDVVFGV